MKEIKIKVNKSTGMIDLPLTKLIGRDMENLQANLIFEFQDEFVDGQARLEYEADYQKNYIVLNKIEETYQIPVKNVITKVGKIYMQLVVTENETEEGIPVFKSNIFYLTCDESLNAVTEAPEGYELWIEQANAKLNQMDNFNIEAERTTDGVNVSITNRLGQITTTKVNDGASGVTVFEINADGDLLATSESGANLDNYRIDENGDLLLTIGDENNG